MVLIRLIKRWGLIGCLFMMAANGYSLGRENHEGLKKYPIRTELSKHALHLRTGMTRQEVINLLGKPTWVQHSSEIPLDWMWSNGNCNPVEVTFNEAMHVNGFDQGRMQCFPKPYRDVPGNQALCTNKENTSWCQP